MPICIREMAQKPVAQLRAIACPFFLLNTTSVPIIAQRHHGALPQALIVKFLAVAY